MIEGMCRRFGEMCGTTFELAKPFSQDYLAMIPLYNNYDMHRRGFIEPQDEAEVIEILRRELDVGEYKSELKWWYDVGAAVSPHMDSATFRYDHLTALFVQDLSYTE